MVLLWTALALASPDPNPPALGDGPAASTALSPPPLPPLPDQDLQRLGERRWRTERTGMKVLLGWSVANLGAGTAGALTLQDPRQRAFMGGNATWNIVNLGLAGASLLGNRRPKRFEHPEVLHQAERLERTLLINTGLDVAYMVAGWALIERGLRQDQPSLQGLGDALLVQGGFLFGFDLTLLLVHNRWTRRLKGRVRSR
ncbi:MAG: hypothetical protein EA397_15735 [Deltaproteobacteria bacterium]|nr:MAG: hypothetical protein EA397_15735 [Deltaproteobacteria bacterium]